jgi:hypothetical protein
MRRYLMAKDITIQNLLIKRRDKCQEIVGFGDTLAQIKFGD